MLCGRVITTWLVTHRKIKAKAQPSFWLSVRLLVPSLLLCLGAVALHLSGTSRINRWTFSPSYVLLSAGTGQFALTSFYIMGGPVGGAWGSDWIGEPVVWAGRTSLLIYLGHSVAKVRTRQPGIPKDDEQQPALRRQAGRGQRRLTSVACLPARLCLSACLSVRGRHQGYLPFSLRQDPQVSPSYAIFTASGVLGVLCWMLLAWQLDKNGVHLVI